MRPRPKTRNKDHKPAGATSREAEDGEPLPGPKMRNQDGREQPPRSPGAVKMTTQRPAGATSTGDGEPLPGVEKTEATTRQKPAKATSNEAASNLDLPIYLDLKSLSVARPPIDRVSRVFSPITKSSIWIFVKICVEMS